MTKKSIDELIDDYGKYHAMALCFRKKEWDDSAEAIGKLMTAIEEVADEYGFREELDEMKNLVAFEHEKSWAAREEVQSDPGRAN